MYANILKIFFLILNRSKKKDISIEIIIMYQGEKMSQVCNHIVVSLFYLQVQDGF